MAERALVEVEAADLRVRGEERRDAKDVRDVRDGLRWLCPDDAPDEEKAARKDVRLLACAQRGTPLVFFRQCR